jgi:23S rRNA (adenine2503-C2)-methyltransferase
MSTESPHNSDHETRSQTANKERGKPGSCRRNLFGMSLEALEAFAVENGEKSFRGQQIFQWMYQKLLCGFDGMSNLNRPLREKLAGIAEIRLPEIVKEQADPEDDTRKFLVRLGDGEHIETVLIPVGGRLALCMSSQVGCPIGCGFCATGLMGFRRNLAPGEMLGQLMLAQDQAGEQGVSTVVLMGMGEPLLNLDNVVETIHTAGSEKGLGFGARRFTISTVGLINGIRKITEMKLKAGLALSLHSPIQELREQLIPLAKSNPLDDLIPACRDYAAQQGDRITLEYLLIAGVTDTMDCAKALAKISNQLPCKINLIAYNPIADAAAGIPSRRKQSRQERIPDGAKGLSHSGERQIQTPASGFSHSGESQNPTSTSSAAGARPQSPLDPTSFRPPTQEAIDKFRDYLYPRCPAVTFRQPKGLNIAAACGQLATQAKKPK